MTGYRDVGVSGVIPDPETCPTLSVPEAGRLAYSLGRNASYEACRRGQLPVTRIGRRLRVPTALLRKQLGLS